MNQSKRYDDLDALRGILMILGIVLHSANIFSPNVWAIQNSETSVSYQNLVDFIHAFRMPAFFIVSGFFLHYSFQRHGAKIIRNQRLPRILIPLVVTAITLNSIQYSFLHAPSDLLTLQYWIAGKWASHLWFLNVLIYYFAFAYLCFHYIPKVLDYLSAPLLPLFRRYPSLIIFVMPLISLAALKISYLVPESSSERYYFSIAEAIKYAPYFIFGLFIHGVSELRSRFLSLGLCLILMATWTGITVLEVFVDNRILDYLQDQYLSWGLSAACFAFFHRFITQSHTVFTNLSNASYSIYLFHHICVIAYGSMIIALDIPTFIKFLMVMTLTFMTTYLIHGQLVSKINMLSYLFNGKTIQRKEKCIEKDCATTPVQ